MTCPPQTLAAPARTALAALAALATAMPAAATDATYTSEAAFGAAAGLTFIESFEDSTARTRQQAPVLTPLLAVVTSAPTLGVQSGPAQPEDGFGSFATEGSRYLLWYAPAQAPGQLRFDLGTPTTAFALDLTDIEVPNSQISITTDRGAFSGGVLLETVTSNNGNGSLRFFGITQDTAFSQVTITVTGVDDAVGIDRIQLAPVPEPASAALLAGGLALLLGRRVARRR